MVQFRGSVVTSEPDRRHSLSVSTLEQIRGVLAVMPHATEIERRNRGLIAFTLTVS